MAQSSLKERLFDVWILPGNLNLSATFTQSRPLLVRRPYSEEELASSNFGNSLGLTTCCYGQKKLSGFDLIWTKCWQIPEPECHSHNFVNSKKSNSTRHQIEISSSHLLIWSKVERFLDRHSWAQIEHAPRHQNIAWEYSSTGTRDMVGTKQERWHCGFWKTSGQQSQHGILWCCTQFLGAWKSKP